ncbi:hypothetical protein B0H16DRAFT_1889649 [Mycena metata]|uniref:Uncharacterized protein n=1 Tax=Mycena metata TaxID=1033252 RepID=A0AAD7N355_9AGAR|nr:hypothetical protein B0H16DRAFT_1889649 [Mycena metata]
MQTWKGKAKKVRKSQKKQIAKKDRKNLRLWAEGERQAILEPHIANYADALERGWHVERDCLRIRKKVFVSTSFKPIVLPPRPRRVGYSAAFSAIVRLALAIVSSFLWAVSPCTAYPTLSAAFPVSRKHACILTAVANAILFIVFPMSSANVLSPPVPTGTP